MALHRVVQRTEKELFLQQRKDLLGFRRGDELQVHAQVTASRHGHLQPVETLRGVGQHEAARQMNAAVTATLSLDLFVEINGVLLQFGHVGVTVEGMHPSG